VLGSLAPQIRLRCLSSLREICGRQALLPKPLAIPPCYEQIEAPRYRGEFAEVWVGEHQGQRVAIKAMGICSTSDPERIVKVGRPQPVRVDELTISRIGVL